MRAPTASPGALDARDAPSPPRHRHYSWVRTVPVTAGLGRRGVALAIDLVVVSVLTYVAVTALTSAGVLSVPRVPLRSGVGDEAIGFSWLVYLMELPVNLVYFTVLEGLWGRTVGKLVVGARVASLTGPGVTFFDAFLRNLMRLLWVTPIGIAFLFLDLYVVHASEMEQRIGDVAADTVVVVDHAARGG